MISMHGHRWQTGNRWQPIVSITNDRRLGGRPLPGNRFVSFVHAYALCPLPSGNEPKRWSRPFPFSLSAREAFPFPLRSKVKSKWTLCEIQCERKVNSKWKNVKSSFLPPILLSSLGWLYRYISKHAQNTGNEFPLVRLLFKAGW